MTMMQRVIEMPLQVVVDGRIWKLFDVHFEADGQTYSTYIYALDHYHAVLHLDDLRATGRVVGEIGGVIPE